ncbi:MAG: hypothetical protein SVV03_04335 [Candidatus Nanohaloarchaea archaeon]|nr:hypothetical protein [Candidatus Nanohaloarchaea archaeon]
MRKVEVVIDQSVKIEEPSRDTVMACSHVSNDRNRISSSLLIPSEHKKSLEGPGVKTCNSKKKYYIKMFSAGIFLLVKSSFKLLRGITIDREYEGQNDLIKSHLTNFFLNYEGCDKREIPKIKFDYVHNKEDPLCHIIANEVGV